MVVHSYIKELSERVQQVESQMAMSGPGAPIAYRSSMDDGPPPALLGESTYSPEEAPPLSMKRTMVISDNRSPSTHIQYADRDRTPGAGGWIVHSSGQAVRPNSGRASFAVAPDQQPPGFATVTPGPLMRLVQPFWADSGDAAERPSKKQKRDQSDTENHLWEAATITVDEPFLAP